MTPRHPLTGAYTVHAPGDVPKGLDPEDAAWDLLPEIDAEVPEELIAQMAVSAGWAQDGSLWLYNAQVAVRYLPA